ncbi:linocin-M18 [Mycobacterium xenopi 4042]|uniref:Type 1 encapsulin shell protein n=1 Tax=Mycobacterium xenopi 4042 TaxID=1299334 RepID=X7ZXS3_MYCXE|nr:linocin-M18 [Mycobacterium xenopi 4042]
MIAHLRASKPLVRLRVPFTLSRSEIDDVERGSKDSDWDPVKDAAKKLAFVEDRAIFEGYGAASIEGIRSASSNPALQLPADVRDFPDVISQALSELRLAGWTGPMRCCCRPTPTPRSARPPNTGIRSASICAGWSTTTSSGRPPSTAPSC